MYTTKQKRNLLDFNQKLEIIDYAMKYPKSTQKKPADYFSIFRELPIKRRTVGDILSNKETCDSEDDQKTPCK
jgi:hypothetical protein